MSASTWTKFCFSGHMVEVSFPDDDFLYNENESVEIEECPFCHSHLFHNVIDWHDREPETCLVPFEPIRSDNVINCNGDPLKVSVYDVGKINYWLYKSRVIKTRTRKM